MILCDIEEILCMVFETLDMIRRNKPNCQGRHRDSSIILIFIVQLAGFKTEASFENLFQHETYPEQQLIGLAIDEHKEPPLFYDTFFPVVYELETPSWTANDLRLELPSNLTNASQLVACNDTYNGTDLWTSTLCPITLKLNELLEDFAKEMKVFETFNASETKLDTKFSSCHEVKPHFSNHIIDELEIELYLIQVILDCPMSDVLHHKLHASHPSRTKYDEILQLFIATHIAPKFRVVGYSKYAISINLILSLHTTELLDYLLDTFSWTTSINTCNSQRIPRLLVPQEILQKTLLEVRGKVEKKGLQLAIPMADISNYYKLQLADCVMTTSKSYIIRVLIPLVKKTVRYKLIKINPIPFLSNDVKSEQTMICQHRTLDGSLIINAATMQPLARAKCGEAELCRVPTEGDRPIFSKCHTAALLNDTKGMLESCHMACMAYDSKLLPYIKRIRSDQFAVVGASSSDVNIFCKRSQKPLPVTDIPKTIGSMLITLPCSCYLSHRKEKYEINGPCEFHLEMRTVKPKGWTYESLQGHFYNQKPVASPEGKSGVGNESSIKLPEGDDDVDDFNKVVVCESSGYAGWPIYLAYSIMFIGCIVLVGAFFILRNVYVRIGQLEVSTALSVPGKPYFIESEYNRNVPVSFSARSHAFNNNNNNESVY